MAERPPIPRRGPGRRVTLVGLLEAGVVIAGLATIAAWLGRLAWVLDFASHFRVQEAAVLLAAAVVLLVKRRWWWALAAVVLAGIHVAAVLPALGERPPAPAERTLRALSCNVLIKNQAYVDVAAMLDGEKADVVGLVEVNARWVDALLPLRTQWPHVVAEPREKSHGLLLMSRRPILESELIPFPPTERFALRAVVESGGGPITVVLFHPPPPMSPGRWEERNREMRTLALAISVMDGPVLVMGDFNCTPWSPAFHDMLETSGLRDSRTGFGIQPTWPAPTVLLEIPIDHALVSPDLAVVDRRVGPSVGSDHRPIVIDVAVVTSPAATAP